MKVQGNLLYADGGGQVPYVHSPNVGGKLTAKYLVMHYTASRTAAAAIATLTDPAAKVSAHLVISRRGEVTQLVPFDRVAWHAGASQWQGLQGLNRHSIGIEIDNAGQLKRVNGKWQSWFGSTIPDDQVMEAAHSNGGPVCGWHTYPSAQLDTVIAASREIADEYELFDVVGHDDIAPGRKTDPGPAFPMANVRGAVIGRGDDAPEAFQAITAVNLRAGPGQTFEKLRPKALAKGTRMTLRRREGVWCEVNVLNAGGNPDASGWVHGDFVKRV